MKIFLDVGANIGQTLEVVLRPPYRFDVVHSFEPHPGSYQELKRRAGVHLDGRLFLHNFGLADFNGEKNLYGAGIGASLYADKEDIDNKKLALCRFVQASDFFQKHVDRDDLVVMKLNCEGGEALILRDLIRSGCIHLLSHVFIDFDVRKIPSQEQEEANIVSELQAVGFKNYVTQRQEFYVWRSHIWFGYEHRISSWLSKIPEAEAVMELTFWQKKARRMPVLTVVGDYLMLFFGIQSGVAGILFRMVGRMRKEGLIETKNWYRRAILDSLTCRWQRLRSRRR